MKPIISEKDFPTANKFVYLNTANVALTFSGAEQGLKDWVADVAQNGSNNFDEHAEENVFNDLHKAAARMINAAEENIAAGSSATELLCSLAWAVFSRERTKCCQYRNCIPKYSLSLAAGG